MKRRLSLRWARCLQKVNQTLCGLYTSVYREAFDPRTAVLDIERLSGLSDTPNDLHWHLYHATGEQANQLNLKVYGQGNPAILSTVLPILEKFGVAVISAQTYEFTELNQWMQEYELHLQHVDSVDMAVVRQQFETALDLIWHDKVESDILMNSF